MKLVTELNSEYCVAGGILLYPDRVNEVLGICTLDDFTLAYARAIVGAAESLVQDGKPADVVLIGAEAERKGTRISERDLADIMNIGAVGVNLTAHAEKVHTNAQRRRLAEAVQEAQDAILRGDSVEDVTNTLQTALSKNAPRLHQSISLSDALVKLTDMMQEIEKGETFLIPTGFPTLDSVIGGLEKGRFYVLGGRPGSYKTTFSMNVALNAARCGKRVFIAELEMQDYEIAAKFASIHGTGLSASRLGRTKLQEKEWDRFLQTCSQLSNQCDIVMRCMDTNLQELTSEVIRNKCDLLILDYIGIMSDSSSASLYEKMTELSKALKRLAAKHRIPILCLAQLNRKVEERSDKTPMLSDLRDSGGLEQDADVVMFLSKAAELQAGSVLTTVPLTVAKNRNGEKDVTIELSVAPVSGRIFEDRLYAERRTRHE